MNMCQLVRASRRAQTALGLSLALALPLAFGCGSKDSDHAQPTSVPAPSPTRSADASRATLAIPDAGAPALPGVLILVKPAAQPNHDPNSEDPPPPPPDSDSEGHDDLEVMDLATRSTTPLAKILEATTVAVFGHGTGLALQEGDREWTVRQENGAWKATRFAATKEGIERWVISSDGARRAHICTDQARHAELCIAPTNADATESRVPIDSGIHLVTWLDDGRIAVTTSNEAEDRVGLLDPTSGKASWTTSLPAHATWAPGSTSVTRSGEVAWVVADGEHVALKVASLGGTTEPRTVDLGVGFDASQCVLVNDQWTACVVSTRSGHEIVSVSLGDGAVHILDDNDAFRYLASSPDGMWVVYEGVSTTGGEEVRITPIDRSAPEPLLAGNDDLRVLGWLAAPSDTPSPSR